MDVNTNIAVSKVQVLRPSGGSVFRGPYVEYKNTSSKTYKYVHFSFLPYNAVGDAVADKPSSLKATGPQEPGPGLLMTYKLHNDSIWYDNTVDHIIITSIRIEYMDGSKELLDSNAIKKAHKQYKAVLSAEQAQKDADLRANVITNVIMMVIIMIFGIILAFVAAYS
ncbi:MAG: hypothetical protein IJ268_06100 [Proteobacteria bacterium]|nr:hypothetical protein [Pseudomonadota bacterium]